MASGAEVSRLLEGAGLRPTELRRRIFAAILESGRSLSHHDLCETLSGVDRVTIYRNLKILRQSGLVHAIEGVDGVLRYLGNAGGGEGCPGGHPHFLCTECGTMTCLTGQGLPHVELPKGAEARGKQFLVYGSCRSCSRAGRGTA